MAAPRVTLSDTDKQIKMADRALIEAAGKIEAVAALTGKSTSTVGEWQALDNARFMPHPVRLQLEDATAGLEGAPHATAYAARRAGCVLVPLPSVAPSAGDLHLALAEKVKKNSDVVSGMVAALADHRIDKREARALQAECIQSAEAVMQLHALLQTIAEGDE